MTIETYVRRYPVQALHVTYNTTDEDLAAFDRDYRVPGWMRAAEGWLVKPSDRGPATWVSASDFPKEYVSLTDSLVPVIEEDFDDWRSRPGIVSIVPSPPTRRLRIIPLPVQRVGDIERSDFLLILDRWPWEYWSEAANEHLKEVTGALEVLAFEDAVDIGPNIELDAETVDRILSKLAGRTS